MGDLDELNLDKLPPHIRNKLAQLELELSEGWLRKKSDSNKKFKGDVTEKGYRKKREQLLKQHLNAKPQTVAAIKRSRRHKRTTRSESRYHSGMSQKYYNCLLCFCRNQA